MLETKEQKGQMFKDMVMAGFKPLKNIIEWNNLEEQLTEDDIASVTSNIAVNLMSWIKYYKHVKEQKNDSKN